MANYAARDAIMSCCSGLPCDYADATVSALAEHAGVTVIATIDRGHFSVYRTAGSNRFRMVLG